MEDLGKVYKQDVKSVKKVIDTLLNTDEVLEFVLEYNALIFVLKSESYYCVKWIDLKEQGIHLENGLDKRLYDKIVSTCVRGVEGFTIDLENTLSQLVRTSMYIKDAKNHPGSTFTIHRKHVELGITSSYTGLSLDRLINTVVGKRSTYETLEGVEYVDQ